MVLRGLSTSSFGYAATVEPFDRCAARLAERIRRVAAGGAFLFVGHSLGAVLVHGALAKIADLSPSACAFWHRLSRRAARLRHFFRRTQGATGAKQVSASSSASATVDSRRIRKRPEVAFRLPPSYGRAMSGIVRLTIELPEEDFARLKAESRREGVRPEAKVLELIARGLPPDRERATAALARLRQLRAGLPPIDAVEVVRAVRQQLEDRAAR